MNQKNNWKNNVRRNIWFKGQDGANSSLRKTASSFRKFFVHLSPRLWRRPNFRQRECAWWRPLGLAVNTPPRGRTFAGTTNDAVQRRRRRHKWRLRWLSPRRRMRRRRCRGVVAWKVPWIASTDSGKDTRNCPCMAGLLSIRIWAFPEWCRMRGGRHIPCEVAWTKMLHSSPLLWRCLQMPV